MRVRFQYTLKGDTSSRTTGYKSLTYLKMYHPAIDLMNSSVRKETLNEHFSQKSLSKNSVYASLRLPVLFEQDLVFSETKIAIPALDEKSCI